MELLRLPLQLSETPACRLVTPRHAKLLPQLVPSAQLKRVPRAAAIASQRLEAESGASHFQQILVRESTENPK